MYQIGTFYIMRRNCSFHYDHSTFFYSKGHLAPYDFNAKNRKMGTFRLETPFFEIEIREKPNGDFLVEKNLRKSRKVSKITKVRPLGTLRFAIKDI